MHLPQIYPKPFTYYQSPHFEGERATEIAFALDLDSVTLLDADAAFRARFLSQLQTVKFRRAGRLHGDYVIMADGLLAIDCAGTPIKLNCDGDDDWAHNSIFSQMENYCGTEEFRTLRDNAVARWDSMPALPGVPLIAEPYASKNYYHFVIGFLPRVRFFEDAPAMTIGMPPKYLERPFQRDLIGMSYGARRIASVPDGTKLRDPYLMRDPFCQNAMAWLRGSIGVRARRGSRLVYIARRSSLVGRHLGSIEENPEFLAFLALHNFETIDFGAGDMSVAAQIALIDGARLVLSAHGANLTNIAFAEAGMGVIEIVPSYWCYYSHVQIALAAGLTYTGMVCHELNEQGRLVVNLDTLARALRLTLEKT